MCADSAFDVLIVGAGPAGSWAAWRLAREGARVALVDPSHPREKPCGGGVTSRALRLVAAALPETRRAVAIKCARFVDEQRRSSTSVPLLDELVVASRREFDGQLLSAACSSGARLIARRAARIARRDGVWTLTTADGGAVTGRLLIGADGANSLTRRWLSHPFRRDQLSVATGFFARGVTSHDIVIEFTPDPPGYIWSFPRPDHLAIGVCAQADRQSVTVGALRQSVGRWMERTGIARGAPLEPYSWPIPSLAAGDFEQLEIAGPGWALIGDAAGLVDPITREGIFFALQSAEFAAHSIANGRGLDEYGDRVRSEIVAELTRAARFKASFFRPRFIQLMLAALAHSEPIRRVMADLIAGTQTYRSLTWRLAGTLEFGLAWQMLSARSSRGASEPSHPAV